MRPEVKIAIALHETINLKRKERQETPEFSASLF
jgi:hypothetical protein